MAFLDQPYIASELPESDRSYKLVPAGWYDAVISEADVKPTKNGNGQYINIRYDITGPEHSGRVVFGKLNISNQNQQAEKIGLQQLGELIRAIGVDRLQDTDVLLGRRCKIKVKVSPAKDGYEASNDIGGWKALEAGTPIMGSVPPTLKGGDTSKPVAASSAPPWAK